MAGDPACTLTRVNTPEWKRALLVLGFCFGLSPWNLALPLSSGGCVSLLSTRARAQAFQVPPQEESLCGRHTLGTFQVSEGPNVTSPIRNLCELLTPKGGSAPSVFEAF